MPITTPWTTIEGSDIRWTDAGNFPSTSPGQIGNGALRVRYKRVDGVCFYRFQLEFGSTTVGPVGGAGLWYFELPRDVLPADDALTKLSGTSRCRQAVGGAYRAGASFYIVDADGSGIPVLAATYTDADGVQKNVNAIQPFSWVVDDRLEMTGFFDALDN